MFKVSSRPIAKSRVSVGSGGRSKTKQTFVDEYWQGGTSDVYQKMLDNPNLNAGQRAILEESEEFILDYLAEIGEDYDAEDLINAIGDELGEAKFNALSETFEQFAEDLNDDWDHSMGGDGIGRKKFMGREYD